MEQNNNPNVKKENREGPPKWSTGASKRLGEILARAVIEGSREYEGSQGRLACASARLDAEALVAALSLSGPSELSRITTRVLTRALAGADASGGSEDGTLWALNLLTRAGAQVDGEGVVAPLARQAMLGRAEVVGRLILLGADPTRLSGKEPKLPEEWAQGHASIALRLAQARIEMEANHDCPDKDIWQLRCHVKSHDGHTLSMRTLCFTAPVVQIKAWKELMESKPNISKVVIAGYLPSEGLLAPLGRSAMCRTLFSQWKGMCKGASSSEAALCASGSEENMGFRFFAIQGLMITLDKTTTALSSDHWLDLAHAIAIASGASSWVDLGPHEESDLLTLTLSSSSRDGRMEPINPREKPSIKEKASQCIAHLHRFALEAGLPLDFEASRPQKRKSL